jgi:uncharacterized protein YdeI (YjbR/CyaY-like superfamily)
MNPKVDWFFIKDSKWNAEYSALRTILLSFDLNEELKWGCPCYTLEGKNIVLIHGFKEYCALLIFKGVLLNDKAKLLVQQTAIVQSSRQIRFTNLQDITKNEKQVKAYIKEAIVIEKAGVMPVLKKTAEFAMPEEFKMRLAKMPQLKQAFNQLTPGRQRAYLLFFDAPKQSATKESRIDKCIPSILKGKGLND